MESVWAVRSVRPMQQISRNSIKMGDVPNESHSLSPREREVLGWVAQGKSSREVGVLLGISSRTVNEHVTSAVRKLRANNRTHAVAIALRDRLIEL